MAKGADDGAKASTILQFRRLASVLDADMEVLVNALGPRNVAVISGHMFRGKELDEAAQVATEASIRKRAEEVFAAHNVGIVYGALAAGADIILAETALALGAELDVVLPFATERFIETSVKIGDPPGKPGKWEKRFRAILEGGQGVRSLTIMDPTDPVDRDLDGYFFYAFRYAAGCALQRAAMLQTRCRLVVVSDETETGHRSPAPTACSPIGARKAVRSTSFPIRTSVPSGRRAKGRDTPSAPSSSCGTRRPTAKTESARSTSSSSRPARASSASSAPIATGDAARA